MLATLFVTSAHADCGADNMVVDAVMIVDVMAVMTRRRDDDEFWSIIFCDAVVAESSNDGCSPLSTVSSSSSLLSVGATERTRSDG